MAPLAAIDWSNDWPGRKLRATLRDLVLAPYRWGRTMTTPFQSNPATTGSDSRLSSNRWPALPVVEWETTRDTLQLWTRIIGKVHMVDEPRVNHWWNVPLYVTAQGLSTSLISHPSGQGFQIDFDLRAHQLVIVTSAGSRRALALRSGPVADFYAKVMRRVIAHLASTLLC